MPWDGCTTRRHFVSAWGASVVVAETNWNENFWGKFVLMLSSPWWERTVCVISSWLETKESIYASFLQLLMDIIWGRSYFHFCLFSVVLKNAASFKQKSNVTSVKNFYTALYNSFIFLYKYKNSPETPQRTGNLRKASNDGFRRISSRNSQFRRKLSSNNLQITDIRYLGKNLEGGLSSYKNWIAGLMCYVKMENRKKSDLQGKKSTMPRVSRVKVIGWICCKK